MGFRWNPSVPLRTPLQRQWPIQDRTSLAANGNNRYQSWRRESYLQSQIPNLLMAINRNASWLVHVPILVLVESKSSRDVLRVGERLVWVDLLYDWSGGWIEVGVCGVFGIQARFGHKRKSSQNGRTSQKVNERLSNNMVLLRQRHLLHRLQFRGQCLCSRRNRKYHHGDW